MAPGVLRLLWQISALQWSCSRRILGQFTHCLHLAYTVCYIGLSLSSPADVRGLCYYCYTFAFLNIPSSLAMGSYSLGREAVSGHDLVSPHTFQAVGTHGRKLPACSCRRVLMREGLRADFWCHCPGCPTPAPPWAGRLSAGSGGGRDPLLPIVGGISNAER